MQDLPQPIPPHDAHTHTVFSDGRDTVRDMVRAAEAAGLEAIAITDHVTLETSDLDVRREEIERVGSRSKVAVIPGAQCRILDATGRLSLPRSAEDLPLVLASFSEETRGICTAVPADRSRLIENAFGALRSAVSGGRVDVLADPFNLGRFEAALTPGDLPRAHIRDLARLMAEHNVALELSARAWWWHPALSVEEFVRDWSGLLGIFASEGVKFVAGTDAHCAGEVGNNHFTRRIMRLSGIELSMAVNLASVADGH
ncbi:MAG: PHP domain-containing protein [Armatimonadota bacterium]|nr:PHP domain-containing protein [Armatimonadota bacterium]